MKNKKYKFGDKGIWHRPASETTKAKKIPAVVLEQTKEGLLYIFAYGDKTARNLSAKTATIFPSDFKTS